MKSIVLSQRTSFLNGNSLRPIDCCEHDILNWLTSHELLVYPVPTCSTERIKDWIMTIRPCGIVLSGGNDLGDDPARDDFESELIRYAVSEKLPLLGICRGVQLITQYFGGKIKEIEGHVDTRHKIFGTIEKTVNSYHKYGVLSCSDDLKILSRSIDGSIEAIRHKSLPIEGWMWHPEREPKPCELDTKNFRNLFGCMD